MHRSNVQSYLSLSSEIAQVDKLLKPLKQRLAALESTILAEMERRGIDEVQCAGETVRRMESKRTPPLNRAHIMTGLSSVLGAEVAAAIVSAAMARRASSLNAALSNRSSRAAVA